MEKTIVALSTPPAQSAVATVRLSGEDAIEIAGKIFVPFNHASLQELKGYHAAYGEIISNQRVIDEGVALVFRAPKSFTGENMVEITCHGNPYIAQQLVNCAIEHGAVSATAGEFTKRAFLNGKIDLTQAEAIAELISAEGKAATTAALRRQKGELGKKIDDIIDALTYAAAQLTVWSDYPEEEDAPAMTHDSLLVTLKEQRQALLELLEGYRVGAIMQNGIQLAILGSPNVGKSTLLNALTKSQRAIVTEVAGTTRDIVEGKAELCGISLNILDTAGIRKTDDIVEKIGVEKARKVAQESDIILFVLDATREVTAEELALYEEIKNNTHLTVFNKIDGEKLNFQHVVENPVEISAKDGIGLEKLEQSIGEKLNLTLAQDHCLIASQRQHQCVDTAIKSLDKAICEIESGMTLDIGGLLLQDSIEPLCTLVGKSATESIMEQVFANFCVGK